MRATRSIQTLVVITFLLLTVNRVSAQSVHVAVGKQGSIPKSCENVSPAVIEGRLDIMALRREANCKGSGDMLIEYTYVMEYTSHSKDKKGKEESETRVFEVYIPTLKDGANTRGVLIMTSRNGVPVPPEKMEKVRSEAGKDLEKEENRIAKQKITDPAISLPPVVGMKPLGMYPRMTATGFAGFKRRGVTLDVHTVLQQATFTYLGREDIDGRENLIFSFAPNPQGSFDPFEGYVARLKGKAWIDVKDRIVTRLEGWPTSAPVSISELSDTPSLPLAVYVKMIRLPDGNWMPSESRVMASAYPDLFNGVVADAIVKYTDYQRFKIESKDVKIEAPRVP